MREPEKPKIESLNGSFFLAEKKTCNMSATCYNRVVPKTKEELNMNMTKEEVLKGLEDAYKNLEEMYDDNLDRQANLHEQIQAMKENNISLHRKMKDIADKIKAVKDK